MRRRVPAGRLADRLGAGPVAGAGLTAMAAGALATIRQGAQPSLPAADPIEHLADQMPKVEQVRRAVHKHGGDIWIQVDGGVSATTIEQCAEAGADVFVAGSAVYSAQDPDAMVTALRERAEVASTGTTTASTG